MNDNYILIDGSIVDYYVFIQNEGMTDRRVMPCARLRLDRGFEAASLSIGVHDLRRLVQRRDIHGRNLEMLESALRDMEDPSFQQRLPYSY